jgi:peptidyl-prolyl cis-trans isomerase SurA
VEQQVEENFYMAGWSRPCATYLTTMREQAFIDIKPGYTDSGASAKQTKPVYSAYVPPAPKKKKKVERTRASARAHTTSGRRAKVKGPKPDALAPAAPDAAEVADRQTQAGPLGLAGDTSKKKKKTATTTGDKTRLADKKKKTETPAQETGDVPLGPAAQPKQ